jgi:predicted nucleic acid-binding protein
MWKLVLASLALSYSLSVGAAVRCESYFSESLSASSPTVRDVVDADITEQDRALWKVDLQHFYEQAIQFVQKKITVNSVRSTTAIEQRRKLNLMHFLNESKHNEAIDIYRRQFDDVELSYFMIKNDQEALYDTSLNQISRLKLQKRLLKYKRLFAKNYGEYIGVRSYLENVLRSTTLSPSYIEAAGLTLKYLGVHKFSEVNADFASLHIPEERVNVSDIKALFRSSSTFVRLKLVNDFKNEIVSALKYFVSAEVLIQSTNAIFNKFPAPVADKLKSLTGLMKSAQLRNRYLPQIIDIESLSGDMNLKLEELRRKNSISPNDELLVTYARTTDFTDTWNALKSAAEQRALEPNNNIHKAFLERMKNAEARAVKLADISLYEQISNIDVLYTVIQCGILLKVTAPQVFHSAHVFLSFLTSVPFLTGS